MLRGPVSDETVSRAGRYQQRQPENLVLKQLEHATSRSINRSRLVIFLEFVVVFGGGAGGSGGRAVPPVTVIGEKFLCTNEAATGRERGSETVLDELFLRLDSTSSTTVIFRTKHSSSGQSLGAV